MPYCTRCGRSLKDNEKCDCLKNSIVSKIKQIILGEPNEKKFGVLERGKQIVPDIIKPDEGERPIKQYRLARLRSKIRGHYAEGQLQITNKRLIFRAPGFCAAGKTIIHQEFDVNEISGVDVQKGTKLSLLNLFASIFLTFLLSAELQAIFEAFYRKTGFVASLLAIFLFLFCAAGCFFIKKKHWAKLTACACVIGALLGTTGLSFSALDIVFGFKLFTLTNICIFTLAVIWFVVLLRVCFIPDLIFSVRTNSASEAIQIRRRVWGFLFKPQQENSGFSEVLPWDDTEKVANELGALINALQTIGDMAIDKWKEK